MTSTRRFLRAAFRRVVRSDRSLGALALDLNPVRLREMFGLSSLRRRLRACNRQLEVRRKAHRLDRRLLSVWPTTLILSPAPCPASRRSAVCDRLEARHAPRSLPGLNSTTLPTRMMMLLSRSGPRSTFPAFDFGGQREADALQLGDVFNSRGRWRRRRRWRRRDDAAHERKLGVLDARWRARRRCSAPPLSSMRSVKNKPNSNTAEHRRDRPDRNADSHQSARQRLALPARRQIDGARLGRTRRKIS